MQELLRRVRVIVNDTADSSEGYAYQPKAQHALHPKECVKLPIEMDKVE
jgi:hypothetical protein